MSTSCAWPGSLIHTLIKEEEEVGGGGGTASLGLAELGATAAMSTYRRRPVVVVIRADRGHRARLSFQRSF